MGDKFNSHGHCFPKIKIVLLCILFCVLGGCNTDSDTSNKELEEFMSNTLKTYTSVNSISYDYKADGVRLFIDVPEIVESDIYKILGDVSSVSQYESFRTEIFGNYYNSIKDHNDWDNGFRPNVRVFFVQGDEVKYYFLAHYYKERQRLSSNDKENIDLYNTWYGTNHINGMEISPEEIEKRIINNQRGVLDSGK